MNRKCIIARLLDKIVVDEATGCWNWTGSALPTGYGKLTVNGKQTSTHRISYVVHYGPIPPGMHVCHRCDNPRCIRFDHLWLGTPKANMQDRDRKGRDRYKGKGKTPRIRGPRTDKINPDLATEIHQLRSCGMYTADIAQQVGMSTGAIRRFLRGDTWKESYQEIRADLKSRTSAPRSIHRAKLTGDQVREIRQLHSNGVTRQQLAENFDIKLSTLSDLLNRVTWKHID